MKLSYESASRILVGLTTREEATEASLRVAWVLGKHKKAFSDAEIIKECMTKVMGSLRGNKNKKLSIKYL